MFYYIMNMVGVYYVLHKSVNHADTPHVFLMDADGSCHPSCEKLFRLGNCIVTINQSVI